MELKIIAAVSLNGAIGNKKTNDLPWHNEYPEDMKFFRKMTSNTEVIMGRNTFESLRSIPLPNRSNIVITQKDSLPGVTCFPSLAHYITSRSLIFKDVILDHWIIGGSKLYEEALTLPETTEIYLTLIPESIEGEDLIYFPKIDMNKFEITETISLNENDDLIVNKYKRI